MSHTEVDDACVNPLIHADQGPTKAVRVVCCLTIVLCLWAVVVMRRCHKLLDQVVVLSVNHALLTHVLLAATVFLAISFSETISTSKGSRTSDYIYIYTNIFVWQQMVAYLLLAHISLVPTALRDTAIMFMVVTWGMSAIPAQGLALPYFQKEGNYLSCASSLWLPSAHDKHRLSMVIPGCLVMIVLVAVSLCHLAKKRPAVTTECPRFQPTTVQSYCKNCWECAKVEVTTRGLGLLRLMIGQFVLTTLPLLVYWMVDFNPSSVKDGQNYEWVFLSAQASLGSIPATIVLSLQFRLLPRAVFFFPCCAKTQRSPSTNSASSYSLTTTTARTTTTTTQPSTWGSKPQGGAAASCACPHCLEHRKSGDAARAQSSAQQAMASLGKTSVASVSLASFRRKLSDKRRDLIQC